MSDADKAWIKRVRVKGLHGHTNINANFKPSVNIIYGQNGVGKTTLLHIISNIINFDFTTFNRIRFSTIEMELENGPAITLKMGSEEVPEVYIDNSMTSVSKQNPSGSEVEQELFKRLFGKTPVYIPAFRNILEKIDRKDSPWEQTRWSTHAAAMFGKDEGQRIAKESPSVSVKTQQCRQWFGDFTPIIRYPSVREVQAHLIEYWQRAESASQRDENEQIDSAINSILAKIFGQEPKVMKSVIEDLLELNRDHKISSSSLAAAFSKNRDVGNESYTPIDLATLYIDAIYAARERRATLFTKIDRFVSSINEFLLPDRKFAFPTNFSVKAAPKIYFVGSNRSYGMGTLSSGERQLLTLLYAAWSRPDESQVMLIDEPEISLHIDWQRIIIREMSKQGNQQIIACTHSPEIAADIDEGYQLFDNFVDSYDGFLPQLETDGGEDDETNQG